MLELLDSEIVVLESGNKEVTLTNIRIRHKIGGSSKSKLTSIFLEKISSIDVTYKSNPILVGLALVAFLIGGVGVIDDQPSDIVAITFLVGLLLIILYRVFLRHIISIKSDGGSRIEFQIKGMKNAQVHDFVNAVEEAKNNRIKNL